MGWAFPGAGEVPLTSLAPPRGSPQKYGAESDRVGADALYGPGAPRSGGQVVDGTLPTGEQAEQLGSGGGHPVGVEQHKQLVVERRQPRSGSTTVTSFPRPPREWLDERGCQSYHPGCESHLPPKARMPVGGTSVRTSKVKPRNLLRHPVRGMLEVTLDATSLLSLLLILIPIRATSGASSDPSGYQWAGKDSSLTTWLGVEGDIGLDYETVPNSTGYHILNYIDMTDLTNHCQGYTRCWIQIGDSIGYTGTSKSHCHSSSPQAYVEEADVNAYNCGSYPNTQEPLATTMFYTLYDLNSQCNSSGDGKITGWIYNPTLKSYFLAGVAYFPRCPAKSKLFAQTEFDEFGGTGTPTLKPYEYFGYNTTRWLGQSSNGKTWAKWTTSLTHCATTPPSSGCSPLHLTPTTLSGHDQFKTWD